MKITAEEMVAQNQKPIQFTNLNTILEAIKVRQKASFTDTHWSKQLVRDETIKELKEMNFEVEDYEDVHTDREMIRISWEHLVAG